MADDVNRTAAAWPDFAGDDHRVCTVFVHHCLPEAGNALAGMLGNRSRYEFIKAIPQNTGPLFVAGKFASIQIPMSGTRLCAFPNGMQPFFN